MDKEKARFILQSFRPDGADAHDPEFAEALALAVADRELGDWLARERAADAAFAALLGEVEIPDDLRESIVAILAGEAPGGELTAFDADMAGALSSVRAPEGLRDQILAAMEVSTGGKVTEMPGGAPRKMNRWLASAAIAAAVVLGAFIAIQVEAPDTRVVDNTPSPLTLGAIEQASIEFFEGGPFAFDAKDSDQGPLVRWLVDHDLPEPTDLPESLRGASAIGCKELTVMGRPASLICFKVTEGVVHLIVFRLEDVGDPLPALADRNCRGCRKSGWAMASWRDQDEKRAMFLLAKMPQEKLSQVF